MAMLCRTSSDFRNLLLNADPAGLLSDGLLDHLSHALVSPGLLEVSHRDECSACGHRMQRKLCVSCHILTPHGLEPATCGLELQNPTVRIQRQGGVGKLCVQR